MAAYDIDLHKWQENSFHPISGNTSQHIQRIQHQQAPLNRDRGTLPGLYTALLDWHSHLLGYYATIITSITIISAVVLSIPPLFSSFSLPFCFCAFFSHFLYSCISRDHIIVWLPYCIYKCVPLSVN